MACIYRGSLVICFEICTSESILLGAGVKLPAHPIKCYVHKKSFNLRRIISNLFYSKCYIVHYHT